MRLRFIFALLIFAYAGVAQVTTNPALPVDSKPVKIIFDATQGTAGLKDYTGDVYVHTGVITDKSSSSSDWRYVVANWETNLEKAKLTRVSPNIYSLDIMPDIRSFYGVPAGEKIVKMTLVFRSGDRSREGKAAGGLDIFVNVYEEGLFVSVTSPVKGALINNGEAFTISASSSQDAILKLRAGTLQLAETSGKIITAQHTFSESGWKWIVALRKLPVMDRLSKTQSEYL